MIVFSEPLANFIFISSKREPTKKLNQIEYGRYDDDNRNNCSTDHLRQNHSSEANIMGGPGHRRAATTGAAPKN
mgnify:FL=1